MEVVSPLIASPDNPTYSVINCCILGSRPLRLPGFPLSCSKTRNSMLRVVCRLVCFVEHLCVGRGGKLSAVTWTVAFHHTDQPTLIYGAGQPAVPKRTPAWGTCPGLVDGPPLRQPGPPPLPLAIFLYPQPLLRAAALGSANQTLAFPAGAGQSTASICWKRETLRGKTITKAFHCRQMLSVCADFSCF